MGSPLSSPFESFHEVISSTVPYSTRSGVAQVLFVESMSLSTICFISELKSPSLKCVVWYFTVIACLLSTFR